MKYIAFIFTFLFAQTTLGCSFGPDADLFKTAKENYSNSDYQYVLSGTIISKEQNDQLEQEYVFNVSSTHRGEVREENIILKSAGHSCGFYGSEGTHMLVFLREKGVIDESNPRYIFDTVNEVVEAGRLLENTKEKPVEQKACTKEYRPVCGRVVVQCVQAPCPPIDRTYSNTCLAEQENAQVLHTGPCVLPAEKVPTKTKPAPETNIPATSSSYIVDLPTTPPLNNFTEPTTPPPFDNSIIEEVEVVQNWWQRFRAWITRVLSF